ncbi:Nucleotide-binding universal stress protein, UspA family [Maridesulfovibrio ferrireducens]|uniref:Nucleotide-binding universal stress protein, UspA family n=1 Tax=Maridesulfovibrio ferrireducens TaxID=246191 RepID=A0A1G9HBS7_9BACT|nr:universal stress protein [Maridesulfovibrio ferrireducens]SDL10400.1 Nucleotide-binding universal stress protein, UspA family [Maridesulfovibrio ferrireducens]
MFKDIIVGITPTGIDDFAVKAAAEFARKFEANLYLVHVAGMAQGWGSVERLEPSGETAKLKDQIDGMYGEVLRDIPNSQIMVVPGIPHNELLRLARKKNADLVVMGPHTKEYEEKRSKMWGMAGSTLERVSQKARCPVMVVHKDVVCKEPLFENILIATDFSDQAECAVSYGAQMARQYKARLTVMHVADLEAEKDKLTARLESEYGPRLSGLENCSYEVCTGQPPMEILKTSQNLHADLVIMAHHSKEQDPEKAFMGSTVVQVALNAPSPTMSVNRYFDLRCGLMYDQTGNVMEADSAKV